MFDATQTQPAQANTPAKNGHYWDTLRNIRKSVDGGEAKSFNNIQQCLNHLHSGYQAVLNGTKVENPNVYLGENDRLQAKLNTMAEAA